VTFSLTGAASDNPEFVAGYVVIEYEKFLGQNRTSAYITRVFATNDWQRPVTGRSLATCEGR
jgi:hypothetical protein